MKEIFKHIFATPGKNHKVSDFETDYTGGVKKDKAEQVLAEGIAELVDLQDKFYADDQHSMLLVFQAMDAAGKDGTIKHVTSGLNPQGCHVVSFKQPSAEDLDHDYLWRISKNLPERGRIGIFNRSHYEEVIVTKVHPEIILNQKLPAVNELKDVNEDFWKNRYRQINDFERYLTENGVVILKFFLNVSKDEQRRRFLSRLEDKEKNWKFSLGDLKERKYWDDYMKVYSDVLTHTSTECAPWHVIPADHKWFMRAAVGKIICEKMKSLNVHYPKISEEAKESLKKAAKELENEK